jgi:hypothetical protein
MASIGWISPKPVRTNMSESMSSFMVRFIIAGHLRDIYHFSSLLFVFIKDLFQDVLY